MTDELEAARLALRDIPGIGEVGEIARLAATLESRSEHPIAQAVAAHVADRGSIGAFENRPGHGVLGLVDEQPVRVGRRALFEEVPPAVADLLDAAESRGQTAVLVGRGPTADAVIAVADSASAQRRSSRSVAGRSLMES